MLAVIIRPAGSLFAKQALECSIQNGQKCPEALFRQRQLMLRFIRREVNRVAHGAGQIER